MPRPFVAYLRVYEPLRAFSDATAAWLSQVTASTTLDRADAGARERELWLRSQLGWPSWSLPGGRAGGAPAPSGLHDVLVLDRGDMSGVIGTGALAPAPLMCPLDIRPRSAAALAGFMASASGPLVQAVIPASRDTVRAHVNSVMAEVSGSAVHVVSSTWTVPLPWFALVEPDARQLRLAPRDDSQRSCWWRMPMADAVRSGERAHGIVAASLGEEGPARVLLETVRWLRRFDPEAAVELDYGGIVQLLDDEALRTDSSANDVHAIVEAIESGATEEVAERYQRLREFWGELAAHEHFG